MARNNMKFKVGEVWLTRNGKKVTIVSLCNGHHVKGILDEDADVFHYEEGEFDLVEKVQ
jgi:hypothetical protein